MAYRPELPVLRLIALMLAVTLFLGSTSAQVIAALNLDSSSLNPPLNGPVQHLTVPFPGVDTKNVAAVYAPISGLPSATRFFAQGATGVMTDLRRAAGATNSQLAATYYDAATGGWACLTGFAQLTGSAAAPPLKPVNCPVLITAQTVQGPVVQQVWNYTAPTVGAWQWIPAPTADMGVYLSSLSSVRIDVIN